MDEEKQEENKGIASLATKTAMIEGAAAALCLVIKETEDKKMTSEISLAVRDSLTVLKMDMYALTKLLEVVTPQHISNMKKYRADFIESIFPEWVEEQEQEKEND